MPQTVYTIGFTRKNLRTFVNLLQGVRVQMLIDIRLHNTSQLAGYAKQEDLAFICELLGITYEHVPELAPSKEILATFKEDKDWGRYEVAFQQLLDERSVTQLWENRYGEFARICLLCSEHEPEQCHRRLVAEHLAQNLTDITVVHLY